jgi:hypothetical protein
VRGGGDKEDVEEEDEDDVVSRVRDALDRVLQRAR